MHFVETLRRKVGLAGNMSLALRMWFIKQTRSSTYAQHEPSRESRNGRQDSSSSVSNPNLIRLINRDKQNTWMHLDPTPTWMRNNSSSIMHCWRRTFGWLRCVFARPCLPALEGVRRQGEVLMDLETSTYAVQYKRLNHHIGDEPMFAQQGVQGTRCNIPRQPTGYKKCFW